MIHLLGEAKICRQAVGRLWHELCYSLRLPVLLLKLLVKARHAL